MTRVNRAKQCMPSAKHRHTSHCTSEYVNMLQSFFVSPEHGITLKRMFENNVNPDEIASQEIS